MPEGGSENVIRLRENKNSPVSKNIYTKEVFLRPLSHIPTSCLTSINLLNLEEMSCVCMDSSALITLTCAFIGISESSNLVRSLIPN